MRKREKRACRGANAVKRRIALWLTLLTVLLTVLLLAYILIIIDTVTNQTARSELIRVLRENAVSVSMRDGRLQVDSGFRYSVGGINALIYSRGEALLAGQIPVGYGETLPFENGIIRTVGEETQYLALDLWVPIGWEDGLWLRGITVAPNLRAVTSNMIFWTLLTLPLFALVAAYGAYWISCRAFRPLAQIHATADAINEARDLKGRIGLPAGEDEFSRLAATFDGMFERLERSFEAEKQFASDAAHELRTPVAIIKGACEYAARYGEGETPDERRETMEMIHRQANRMARLTDGLLHMTRMEQGSEGGELYRLDLGAEVAAICDETYARDIRLTIHTEEGVFVRADRDLLTRLLCNLIGNAIKYSDPPEHAAVTVTVERGEGEALLAVSDSGIGIPPEAHERIWQRFTRLDTARADGESTGLGLSIVRGIAERFGGYMTLKSEVGVGSTFTLHLPLL